MSSPWTRTGAKFEQVCHGVKVPEERASRRRIHSGCLQHRRSL
jgi:hypothetical protein